MIVVLDDNDNMLLKLPKTLLKKWIRHSGNGFFTIENKVLKFQPNARPIFKRFNVFGLAEFFHDKGLFTHLEFVNLAFSCDFEPKNITISNVMEPSKHFNLSPNYIFQLPKEKVVMKLTLDALDWTAV